MLAEVYRDILSPRIVFDRSNPVLVSNPAVLVAPKRRLGKGDQVFVDRDSADLEPRRHLVSQLQVVRPDTSIQTIVRLVSHCHNFISILEPRHRQDGTKDLVTTDLHLSRHVREDRRFEKASLVEPWIARFLASVQEFRAFCDSVLHCLDCPREIRVGEDYVRILAPELHYDVCNVLGCRLHHLTSSVARACKDDSVDILVRNQCRSYLGTRSRHHVNDALRSPGLYCQLSKL